MTCRPEDRPFVTSRIITRINAQGRAAVEDILLREESWSVFYNGEKVETLLCVPADLESLAVGHLFYRGILTDPAQIIGARADAAAAAVHVEARPANEPAPVRQNGEISLSPRNVLDLQRDFNERSTLFRSTGAAHGCALAERGGILIFMNDIARHNALDKVVGEMLRTGRDASGKALIFSGRLSLDMLDKAARSGVRLLIAPGAPSLAAVQRAEAAGITLLGFVRCDNINIYTHPHRVAEGSMLRC